MKCQEEKRSVLQWFTAKLEQLGLRDKRFDELTCEHKYTLRNAMGDELRLKMGPKKKLTPQEELEVCDRIRRLSNDEGHLIREAQNIVARDEGISFGTVRRIWERQGKSRSTT